MADVRETWTEVDATLRNIERVLDLPKMKADIAELGEQAAAPDLWNDQAHAQKVTSRLSYLQAELNRIATLRRRVDDVPILLELGEAEGDADSLAEAAKETEELKQSVSELEVRTLLSGEYDAREAVITVQAGAGGVDAADWTEMLLRMYLRYCERHGWPTEVYDVSYAEEAGIKSAEFAVHAPYAFGTLSVEAGTHRLVRISPFDNQGRRQTSFARVDVIPALDEADSVEIPDDDIRVDVYRSSGPGGQGVNTTDSAVRITHLPSGIVVSCQNERSQIQNRATAMVVLQAKLLDLARKERQAKLDAIKGDSAGSWGTQMRNYVLHPYQMVKDSRTDVETGNTGAVLDGEIDEFIEAAIRWRKQQQLTA
jgi:peptide chain release factor 2